MGRIQPRSGRPSRGGVGVYEESTKRDREKLPFSIEYTLCIKPATAFNILHRHEGRLEKEDDNSFQEHLICSLYCLLMRSYASEASVSSVSPEHQLFYQIVDYVNGHFDEDINVNVIADKLGIYRI